MKLSGLLLSLAWAAATSAGAPAPTEVPEPPPRFALKPLAQDYYPETARALEHQGTVKVRLCYDDTGRVTASTLEQSSSFESLDRAALRMGRAYILKPGIINGQPQPGCVVVPVEFSLKQPQGPPNHGEGLDGNRPAQPNPPPRLVPLISGTSERSSTESGWQAVC
jgi:TonB family protein